MKWLFVLGSVGVGLITLWLSWIASPRMSDVTWLPVFVGEWADQDPDQRTVVPFILAGCLFTLSFAAWLGIGRQAVVFGVVCAWLLLVIAEGGQGWLPTRGPSTGDLAWGAAGSILGALLAHGVAALFSHYHSIS